MTALPKILISFLCPPASICAGKMAELVSKRFKNIAQRGNSAQDLAEAAAQSRIIILPETADIASSAITCLTHGALLLTHRSNLTSDLSFHPGKHFILYDTPQDLLDKIALYLNRDDLCNRLITSARRYLEQHQSTPTRQDAPLPQTTPPNLRFTDLIPASARKILDVGCGRGEFYDDLSPRNLEITGIEPDPKLAAVAAKRLQRVIVQDIDALDQNFADAEFDCVILRGTLEHCTRPESLLRNARLWLTPGGCLLAEVGNIGRLETLAALLDGDFESAAPASPKRFYTHRSVIAMFQSAQYSVNCLSIPTPQTDAAPSKLAGSLAESGIAAATNPSEPATDRFWIQAHPADAPLEPVSIVIVTCNNGHFAPRCVHALQRFTNQPFDILFVDADSSDDTVESLCGLQTPIPFQIIQCDTDSYLSAIRRGVSQAQRETVAIFSIEALATPDWLTRLLALRTADPKILLAGPSIDDSAPIPASLTDRDLADLAHAAETHAHGRPATSKSAQELTSACLLFSKQILSQLEWIQTSGDTADATVAALRQRTSQDSAHAAIACDAVIYCPPLTNVSDSQRIPPPSFISQTPLSPAPRIIDLASLAAQSFRPGHQDLDAILRRELHQTKDHPIDRISFGSLLQWLRDPLPILKLARACLSPTGTMTLSFQNVAHRQVIADLLDGIWPSPSLVDSAPCPIHFYTPRKMEKLLARAGFAVKSAIPLGPDFTAWTDAGRKPRVRLGPLTTSQARLEDAQRLHAQDYFIEATVVPKFDYGLTSIVIVHFNNIPALLRSIQSIAAHAGKTRPILVADLGSSDDPGNFLEGRDDVTFLPNPPGVPYAQAVNDAVRQAPGRQILLIHCGMLLPSESLDRMLHALHSSSATGAVAPTTNAQDAEHHVSYDGPLSHLDRFASDWAKSHDAAAEPVNRAPASCILFRRRLASLIGPFDPQFDSPRVTVDDFCRRGLAAGCRILTACDAFVLDSEKIVPPPPSAQDLQRFNQKWRCADAVLSVHNRPRLSLCMIVRDSEKTLAPCLQSIRPWVDEIIVVDTGSRDSTPQIARDLGANVFHFPWCSDFAAARNQSLRRAAGDWLFWMDSDDTIDPANGQKLRDILQSTENPAVMGYVVKVHCPGRAGESMDLTAVDHVKLFRNLPHLRFEGRIHEQILPSIRRAGGDVRWTDIFVTHSGADYSPAGRRRKLGRDRHLLKLDLRDRPNHPFVLFNLGMTWADDGDHAAAVDYLRQSLLHSDPSESHVRKIYALLVCSLTQLRRLDESLETCRAGLSLFPDDAELNFRAGITAHRLGKLPEAEQYYLQALAPTDRPYFKSVDPGVSGFKARYNLAAVYLDMGRLDDAFQQYQTVVREAPDWLPGWRALVDLQIEHDMLDDARASVRRLEQRPALAEIAPILKSRIAQAETCAQEAAPLS